MLSIFPNFFFCLSSVLFISDNYVYQATIHEQADLLSTDNLGNVYIVKNDVLKKYDASGKLFKTYTNKSFGAISFIDASNAMRPLVYYRDFFQIIFLDNTLTPNGAPINLLELNFQQPSLVCLSHNGFWVYDQQNFELSRVDQNLEVINKSGNLSQLLGEIKPSFMVEYNNRVYMNNINNGIMVFDIYGNYFKTIPIQTSRPFQVRENDIVYMENDSLKLYNLKSFDTSTIQLPDSFHVYARIENQLLYIQASEKIDIYAVRK